MKDPDIVRFIRPMERRSEAVDGLSGVFLVTAAAGQCLEGGSHDGRLVFAALPGRLATQPPGIPLIRGDVNVNTFTGSLGGEVRRADFADVLANVGNREAAHPLSSYDSKHDFVGLAINPDGRTAYAMPQSAMRDEGGSSGTIHRIVAMRSFA